MTQGVEWLEGFSVERRGTNMTRNWQTVVTLVAVLIVAILLLQPLQARVAAQEGTGVDTTPRSISVSGVGQASAQPDIAIIQIGVQTQDEQANVALNENSQRMQAIVSALQNAGVATEDIQTEIIQLQPRFDEPRLLQPGASQTQSPELIGYIATNILEVRVTNLDQLGQLLDTAVQAGGNRIEGIRFELENPAEVVNQARQAAWEEARQKAEALANLAGEELNRVLSINESSNVPRPFVQERLAADATAVPIQPGTQTVEVAIQVTWSLVR
jgi:hypothetical protein